MDSVDVEGIASSNCGISQPARPGQWIRKGTQYRAIQNNTADIFTTPDVSDHRLSASSTHGLPRGRREHPTSNLDTPLVADRRLQQAVDEKLREVLRSGFGTEILTHGM